MKRITTLTRRLTAMLFVALLSQNLAAQEIGALDGYINIYVRVMVAVEGSGTVSATPLSGGLTTYRNSVDFKATVPVSLDVVYFNVKARPTGDYTFDGWYLDDGDGVFDIEKDEQLSVYAQSTLFLSADMLGLDPDFTLYGTETEADLQGEHPSEPQAIVFANITRSAIARIDHDMEHCGRVETSNTHNAPGDVVTVRAIAAEGYQFEYWKTGYGTQIYSDQPNTVVSTEPEYTFTVKGGERYYAYFSSKTAPTLHLPEEGGWATASFGECWFLHELSQARVYNFTKADIITNDKGQTFMNLDDEDGWYDCSRKGSATLIYGKGTVRFTHTSGQNLNYDRRDNILRWSGPSGTTINDPDNVFGYHVYALRPDLEAFVRIGTTDVIEDDNAPTQVAVPANTCYICMEGIDIGDSVTGDVPVVIGLSPDAFDKALAGVKTVQTDTHRHADQLYDLQGRRVGPSPVRGLYIKNGKTVFIK